MESYLKTRNKQRKRRKFRVRKAIKGKVNRPRLAVFRSNKHLFAQLIDDESSVTLFGIGTMSKEFKGSNFAKKSKEAAREIGKRIAAEAKSKNVERVVFDRRHYKYHGLVQEIANGAREAGLTF